MLAVDVGSLTCAHTDGKLIGLLTAAVHYPFVISSNEWYDRFVHGPL